MSTTGIKNDFVGVVMLSVSLFVVFMTSFSSAAVLIT